MSGGYFNYRDATQERKSMVGQTHGTMYLKTEKYQN